MPSRHRVSRGAIELIKRFEGYRRHAVQLPDGRWMIGYGHTLTAREGAEVSEADAEALLLYDLITVAHTVNENVFAPTTQNQFDALCSFAFNIGLDNFRRSQVLKRLNAGSPVQAACAMELWRKADFEGERIVVDALVRRRAAEKTLFLTPEGEAWVPAPSPLLRPAIDLDALDLVPQRRPVNVETATEGGKVVLRRDDWPTPGVDEPPAEPTPPPAAAVTAAAEAVASRLESLFPDPGEEPDPPAEPAPAEPEAPEPPRADLEPAPELAAFTPADLNAPAEETLDIPAAPEGSGIDPPVRGEAEPFDLIPARKRPPAPRPEASVVWDLLLALSGLAFFGFGLFWGLNARPAATGAVITPLLVAWTAGLAGIGFVTVSVYHLLQRVGREAERD